MDAMADSVTGARVSVRFASSPALRRWLIFLGVDDPRWPQARARADV